MSKTRHRIKCNYGYTILLFTFLNILEHLDVHVDGSFPNIFVLVNQLLYPISGMNYLIIYKCLSCLFYSSDISNSWSLIIAPSQNGLQCLNSLRTFKTIR